MGNKKAVSQIVTTILLILLVLAAIVIVWQAVKGTIESGSQTIAAQSKCMGLDLNIEGTCTVGGTDVVVTVTRGGDSVGEGTLKITAASGAATASNSAVDSTFNALDTAGATLTFDASGVAGATVAINTGVIIEDEQGNDVMCAGAKKTITCATA